MIYGYSRVSTVEQVVDGSSIPTQRSQILGYCQMKGWAEPPTFFVEEGVSGSVPLGKRPQGGLLLEALKPGDIVITPKLDRMFRSASDALTVLEQLKSRSISLNVLDLGGDVCGNGVAKFIFAVLASVAEMERDRLRERIREVKAHMKETGLHHGGPRPYGFDVVNKRYVPVPREQAVIRRIRELRATGAGARRIATILRNEDRADFAPIQVQRILERTGVLAA